MLNLIASILLSPNRIGESLVAWEKVYLGR